MWIINDHDNGVTNFHFEISADILKPQELELLRRAPKDRFQFEVGVQTTNDEVLNRINRFVNFSDIKEKVVELLEIKNIKQHLDLIAGLPGEDIASFKKSFNDVYSIEPPAQGDKLLKLSNFYLTPHTAARTQESEKRTCKMSSEIIVEHLLEE